MRKAICIMVILVLMAGLTSCGKSKLEKSNERLAETFSHIAEGAERWDNMVNGTEEKAHGNDNNISVQSVIDQLKDAGLPIEYSIVYTSENDPNGPGELPYIQKGNFADSTLESEYSKEEPLSGSVEIFSSKEKAIERADYLTGYGIINDFDYQILNGCILLRLNSNFDRSAVEKYAQAIGGEIYSEPGNDTNEPQKEESDFSDYFLSVENPDIFEAFLNPEKYVGRTIVFEAKLTTDITKHDELYMFQVQPTDPTLDMFTVVVGSLEDRGWKKGEIQGITGKISGSLDGDIPIMVIKQNSSLDTKR